MSLACAKMSLPTFLCEVEVFFFSCGVTVGDGLQSLEMAATHEVRILSRRMIRPSPRTKKGQDEEQGRIHLTPWDLKMLCVDYIQKGLLFHKIPTQQASSSEDPIISSLVSSFACALDHFYPLAGRLATVKHDTCPPSLSIFLDCNDEGAEFIHASAAEVTVSDILTPLYIPTIINSFFPLNGAIGHDGHSMPLLAVQITQLADGIFIACSLNHAVADGTSFWHFINSWSEIARTGAQQIPHPPVLDRWFLDSCQPPIRLLFRDPQDFIKRPVYVPVRECHFHFSAQSIAKLKSKANAEMGTDRISSLQALLAHLWRSVTRARDLEPLQEVTYMLLAGHRSRLNPPLPEAYLGNCVNMASAEALAGEVVSRGLGWTAWLLNQAIASQSEAAVRDMLESWMENPSFPYVGLSSGRLATGSSPRFNMYGNDFGWGRPVAVRSGCGNKMDGKVTVYPGPQEGSMALEVCLSATTLSSLVVDKEFMEAVSNE